MHRAICPRFFPSLSIAQAAPPGLTWTGTVVHAFTDDGVTAFGGTLAGDFFALGLPDSVQVPAIQATATAWLSGSVLSLLGRLRLRRATAA